MRGPLISFLAAYIFAGIFAFECDKNAYICRTSLEITNRLTMFHETEKAVYPKKGSLYRYDVTNITDAVPVNIDEVVTGDGWERQRMVVVANGTLPGPSIIGYKDQVLVIRVTNMLPSEGVSIHWHGIEQKGTPYMDGVGFVTQCPINPGQAFTYTFKLDESGTFWYHSHIGAQESKGLYGALIVRDKDQPTHLQNVSSDFILQVQDWNHDYDADQGFLFSNVGVYINRTKVATTLLPQGHVASLWNAHSSLFNGKGRYHDPQTGVHNEAPLEVFEVQEGNYYRFRVINVASVYSYRISVDNHTLSIIGSDDELVKPVDVESFWVHPGERFDFVLHASAAIGNYLIRGVADDSIAPIPAEAILHYSGAEQSFDDVTSERVNCTDADPCTVLNCPFPSYPSNPELRCMSVDALQAFFQNEVPGFQEGAFQEHFLNFVIPGSGTTPRTINNIHFQLPPSPVLSQPNDIPNPCSKSNCTADNVCTCTNIIDLFHNNTIQFVFMNMGKRKTWHSIHMHGHSFDVLKLRYANYNETTGEYISQNADISCGENATEGTICNKPKWSDPSWLNGNITGLNLVDPPRKDTVVVPYGGYVVVRIKADNPGFWMLHCHLLPDVMDGMVLLLNESFAYLPETPKNFPTCGHYEGIDPGISILSAISKLDSINCSQQSFIDDMVLSIIFVSLPEVLLSTPAPMTTTPIPTTTEPASK